MKSTQKSKYVAISMSIFLVIVTFSDCKPSTASMLNSIKTLFEYVNLFKKYQTIKNYLKPTHKNPLPKLNHSKTKNIPYPIDTDGKSNRFKEILSQSESYKKIPESVKKVLYESACNTFSESLRLSSSKRATNFVRKEDVLAATKAAEAAVNAEARRRGYIMTSAQVTLVVGIAVMAIIYDQPAN